MSFTTTQPNQVIPISQDWEADTEENFMFVMEMLGLENLMLDTLAIGAFEKISGIDEIPLYQPDVISRGFHPLEGQRVWVKHSFVNDEPACATIKGDTIGDILLAIDEALENQLTEDERGGGRSCYLEGAFFPKMDEYTLSKGIRETDIIIELGS